ncbi:hypothetical protein DYL61_08170 [Pseudomonas nabeulensis]|uniref:Uncharacterized protein n=1 Tax=Pseudomonas nabeulensis TaxID=2293833 RepID=A0A4Z0B7Y9_9PSED|nr:hypothetical protein DYL61_08170 [Pseudomonas nabeulensis]
MYLLRVAKKLMPVTRAIIGKLKNCICVSQGLAPKRIVGPAAIRVNPSHFLIRGCFKFLSSAVAIATKTKRIIQEEYSVIALCPWICKLGPFDVHGFLRGLLKGR